MIIGDDFNTKAKQILKELYQESNGIEELRVGVKAICDKMELDKTEARNLLEYLESKGCITIETLGGPYLYGDVSLTKKGIHKAQK